MTIESLPRAVVSKRRNPITRKMRWWVTYTDPGNNEKLAHSEQLTSRANVEKNVAAMCLPPFVIEWPS